MDKSFVFRVTCCSTCGKSGVDAALAALAVQLRSASAMGNSCCIKQQCTRLMHSMGWKFWEGPEWEVFAQDLSREDLSAHLESSSVSPLALNFLITW